jgi:dihydroorotase
MTTIIQNTQIINEGKNFKGSVLIVNGVIAQISKVPITDPTAIVIDGEGKYLIPGLIDDQVHFREPGLTNKADIYSESRAAVAGGITSFMEMPNTIPNTLTQELLQDKYDIAAENSIANYSFFMGASNDNLEEVLKTNPRNVCGVKVFMGSSTGNMLVDNTAVLEELFSKCKMLIASHCEDEPTVKANEAKYKEQYGEEVPISCHPEIRSAEACYLSSSFAVNLAKKHGTRFHVLHISTARETELFDNSIPLKDKKITSEACVHHLWFSDEDYDKQGTLIKWNPAVKTANDRNKVFEAVLNNKIDIIATDHAPHTLEEKQNTYFNAPSGGPLVQHALVSLLEHYHNGKITLEQIVEKACHAPADCFNIEKRGYLREGYHADLVLIDLNDPWTVDKSNILYKCGWSPFEGVEFQSQVSVTIVNGNVVYQDHNMVEGNVGQRLLFTQKK